MRPAASCCLAKTCSPLRYVWSWPENADVAALDPAMVALPGVGRFVGTVTFALDPAAPERLPGQTWPPVGTAGRSRVIHGAFAATAATRR